ncbi:MAG: class I SAM-dependent methyltransferase [Lachnospiraceae bacterium]|nr:class I SAM-dependent methyltransferase [Lachnospiraceae bacterium]
MSTLKTIIHENKDYWTQRASTYSDVNKWELDGISRERWKNAIRQRIIDHYPEREPQGIKVLDIGTGPGFFAIILAECGYDVTAIDLTPNMLLEASSNAGPLADAICFMEMNAEELEFDDSAFDVIVTRNLTWNLPHPADAYREWYRVLKNGGLMLNFDSNWYSYLFDDDARQEFENDRTNSASLGIGDQNVGDNFDVMEDIASRVPLSNIARPEWDMEVLSTIGFKATADIDIWQHVWTPEEKVNFASTPMFLIHAVK